MTIKIVRRERLEKKEKQRQRKEGREKKRERCVEAGGKKKKSADSMNRNRALFRLDRVADTLEIQWRVYYRSPRSMRATSLLAQLIPSP